MECLIFCGVCARLIPYFNIIFILNYVSSDLGLQCLHAFTYWTLCLVLPLDIFAAGGVQIQLVNYQKCVSGGMNKLIIKCNKPCKPCRQMGPDTIAAVVFAGRHAERRVCLGAGGCKSTKTHLSTGLKTHAT